MAEQPRRNCLVHRSASSATLAVLARENWSREDFQRKKKSFLGRKAVLVQSPFSFPKTHSLRFALNPHIACVDKWKRLEAIQALGEFLRGHATALRQWIAGHRSVAFPFGTYWMAIFHRARCAPAPT